MTNQEIFDRACEHLADQGRPAMNAKGECMYRGPKGTMCAVGCLIPDEIYRPAMENMGFSELSKTYLSIEQLFSNNSLRLLSSLQIAHDNAKTLDDLKFRLNTIAHDYSLNPEKISLINKWEVWEVLEKVTP